MAHICILSGLEIPKGQYSKEHLVPKARAGVKITQDPRNILPAAKIMNHLKADYLPCEFWEQKYNIAYKAISSWNIRHADKEFIQKAIENWERWYNPNWCEICLLNCKGLRR